MEFFRKMCDESGSVTPDMTADWLLSKLPSLLEEYALNSTTYCY